MNKIASMIDHTLLSPSATSDEYEKLCDEAIEYGFKTVCVPPRWVKFCADKLAGHVSEVCSVIGFPLGHTFTEVKVLEAQMALANGANEVDMVFPIHLAKEHLWEELEADIRAVKQACGTHTLKVILETCLLTDEEIVEASKVSVKAGANFVKTSTGFSKSGATTHAITLMRESVGDAIGVKASGGIRDLQVAKQMILAGANRLGTSSGVAIIGNQHSASGSY